MAPLDSVVPPPPPSLPDPHTHEGDLSTLRTSRLLARLDAGELEVFFAALDQVALTRGTVVVREGDADADYMYFVLEGKARAQRGQLELRTLGPGDHFGELAMIGVRTRAATIEAATTLRLARLSRARYAALSTAHPPLVLRVLQALTSSLGDELALMTDKFGMLLHQRSLPRRTEVRVKLGDESRVIPNGTLMRSLLAAELEGAEVVAGMLDRKPVSLDTAIVYDASIDAMTTASWEGREVYRRSVGLLVLEAAERVAKDDGVRLGPSIGSAQVVVLDPAARPDANAIGARLAHAMRQMVSTRAPFREELWTVEEARSHFAEVDWRDAAALFRTRRDATVSLVSCGAVYALSFGPVLPDASAIRDFRFVPHPEGLLLDFGEPVRRHMPLAALEVDPILREQAVPRFGSEMAREEARWLRAMGVTSVGAFNDFCISGQVSDIIRVSEGFHEKRIGRIADGIAERGRAVRAITVAGPSSSGKTTFLKRLSVQLEINGLHPVNISLDDYYLDREKTGRDEKGEYDFEAFEALDIALLDEHVGRLLAGQEVRCARYDFLTGKSHREGGKEVRLREGDVLMFEGIHGLNPALLSRGLSREQIFSIFIQPQTALPFDRLTSISPADVRLLRRIVRDRHHRGNKAQDNIMRWPSVRRGELLHIFPYQPNADVVFDSSLVYELSVLKVYAERYLLEVPQDHPAYSAAYRLRHLVDRFVTIYPDHVPPTSLLREFIGGSGFEY